MAHPDVAIIGGGIVGCCAAAFLAEAGATVDLYESRHIAAAASGRNSGVVQHPLDPDLEMLYRRSLQLHELRGTPDGVMVVARETAPLANLAAFIKHRFPELGPELLPDGSSVEPLLAPGVPALRLMTGHLLEPASATRRFAERARRAGARVIEESPQTVEALLLRAGTVLVTAGPWTSQLLGVDVIRPVWGVVAELALEETPSHVIEEVGVDTLVEGAPPAVFSLCRAALGSTFDHDKPDPQARVPSLRQRGRDFVPAVGRAPVKSLRRCARPQSIDGKPFIGPVPWMERVHVCAGHGAWGISLGPASARMAADAILGTARVPPPLAASRIQSPG